jgi:erythromycin esterase-like protein
VLRFLLLLLIVVPAEARVRAVRGETPATWLRRHAITSFAPTARIVALGDATHGTHELYDAHVRMTLALVDQGVTTLAFEAPFAEFARIDDYVRTGEGDLSELLRSHPYWFWDTQEVFDLLTALRGRGVRIAGVDAANVFTSAEYVVEKLRERDPSLAAFAESQYACLHSPPSDLCRSLIAEVRPRVPAELQRAARMVEQGNDIREDILGRRDQYLAENLLALDGRVVVWGHNEHWGRTDYHLVDPQLLRPAGVWLHEALGADYVAVGSVVRDGTFAAVETTDRPRLGIHTINAPAPDDWALLFDQAGRDELLVPVHPAWPARPMRIAGSSVVSRERATLEVRADLARKFDFVLYVRTSTPVQLRHWPVW